MYILKDSYNIINEEDNNNNNDGYCETFAGNYNEDTNKTIIRMNDKYTIIETISITCTVVTKKS